MGEIKERKVIDENGNLKSHEVEITLDAHNYRVHDERNLKLIKKSLKECGAGRSILIDADGEIIAGNATYKTAQETGIPVKIIKTDGNELIAVQRTDLSTKDKKRKKLALMDNSTSDKVAWDIDTLSADFDLSELPELGLEDLPEVAQLEPEITEDEVPSDEQVETRVKKGDIWQLGEHRLMCGDSTVITDVEKLMNGEKADISFQSPPYNAALTPTEFHSGKTSKYANDDDNKSQEDYLQFLSSFTEILLSFSKYTFVNLQMLKGNKIAFCEYLNTFKEKLADIIVWDKLTSQPAMAENVLNSEFEFVLVFSEKGNRVIGTRDFRGTEKNIVHISKQNKNKVADHNATFPLEFVAHFIKAFTKGNDLIIDLFGGSGSTLIACEQLKRKCRMMELDEHYCDVILTRWETLTGKQAQRIE